MKNLEKVNLAGLCSAVICLKCIFRRQQTKFEKCHDPILWKSVNADIK